MERDYHVNEINDIARLLLELTAQHRVIAFEGEMGAGKTTLIHAVYLAMGAQGNFGSPTFSIINEYEVNNNPVYHIDLYRCKDEEEAIRAGVEDCLYSGHLCLVEWPSRAPGIFPEDTLRVTLGVTGESTRHIIIEKASSNQARIPLNRL